MRVTFVSFIGLNQEKSPLRIQFNNFNLFIDRFNVYCWMNAWPQFGKELNFVKM